LDAQREEDRGARTELKLQEALAISSMWTRGVSREVRAAIDRGLELSRTLRDDRRYIRFLVGLNILLVRLGDFRGALSAAKRSAQAAHRSGGAAEKVVSEWMLGASHHFAGNLKAALRHCERGFKLEADTAPVPMNLFGFDQRVRARVALARSLSLLGKADQGHKTARQAIREAEGRGPISHCIALLYCIPVFLWRGAFEEAAELIELAVSTARKYSLTPYHALGLALKGELMIGNGDAPSGVDILREALGDLKRHHHHIVVPTMMCAMAEGLVRSGHPDEALALITEGLEHAEQIKEIFWMPDLLRVHGEVLLASARPDYSAAEKSLLYSIDSARKQFALSWELKAAIPLARIWRRHGRREAARAILDEIHRRFKEGFGTRDLIAARRLLDELNDAPRSSAK
jgi:ATP/maltotriose-dependent transcriptional regulator MalT